MFSVFTDNDVARRTVINNENSVVARKPTLSARKPLTDRKANLQEATPSMKTKETPQPALKEKPAIYEFSPDYCSYYDVPDKYEDLSLPDLVLGNDTVDKIVAVFSRRNEDPKAPKLFIEEPKLIDTKFEVNNTEMLDADGITELLKSEINLVNKMDLEVPLVEDIL